MSQKIPQLYIKNVSTPSHNNKNFVYNLIYLLSIGQWRSQNVTRWTDKHFVHNFIYFSSIGQWRPQNVTRWTEESTSGEGDHTQHEGNVTSRLFTKLREN